MTADKSYWRLCSGCKKELNFEGMYYACSVSTCNRKRMALTFCSVPCWEAHLPMMRHREAWALEKSAPSQAAHAQEKQMEADKERAKGERPERRIVGATSGPVAGPLRLSDDVDRDILIVVSKLKAYVKARADMKTSDGVADMLSDLVRELVDAALHKAAEDGRKTLMDRDF